MDNWPQTKWQDVQPPSHHFVKAATVHLRDLVGRPLQVLEIGVFKGGSARWLLDNVLTHPDAAYTGIDPYGFNRKRASLAEADAAAALAPHAQKVVLFRQRSIDVLPALAPRSFDLIHVDGDHAPGSAFSDGELSWRLLKPGGLIAFDDLFHGSTPVVKPAFEAFRTMHPDAELLEDARQGWLRKPS